MYFAAALLSYLPVLAAAAPAYFEARTPSPILTLIAARSASPIHFQPVNANGRAFWLGKPSASYCPQPPVTQCPAGTSTTLIVNDGAASLAVEVPGGQQIYIRRNGALSYTAPHSGAIPPGSTTLGFIYTPGERFGFFSFTGHGATGLLACPSANGTAPYQIFANIEGLKDKDVPGKRVDECLGFDALAEPVKKYGAWEYI